MICFPLDNTDYTAKDLGAYLCTRTRGVFSADDNFAVTANNNMTVTVSSGISWLKWSKYWGTSAVQPQATTLSIERADGALSRIDAVYVRLNKVQNLAEIGVKKGSFSSSPTVAAPERNDNYDEIYLATVLVSGGVVKITQAAITDMRTNDAYCGIMRDAVTGIPTANLQAQAQELIDHLRTQITAIEQGSAVMLKSVFVGKTADSVKKADVSAACTGNAATATTATTCTGNAATATTATTATNADAVDGFRAYQLQCVNADMIPYGFYIRPNYAYRDGWGMYLDLYDPQSTIDPTVNVCIGGHATQDAFAPVEAVCEGQSVGTEGIGTDIYRYPNGCNAVNCFVAAVFSNIMQIAFTASMNPSTFDVSYNMVAHPTKVIVQRYK